MKKLLIASDSHGNFDALLRVVEAEPGATDLIFLGDGLSDIYTVIDEHPELRVYLVRGNCDFSQSEPAEGLSAFDHQLFFYCHGDGYQVKCTLAGLKYAARQRGADVVLFGHTHSPYYEYTDGLYVFNPGSVSRPRIGRPTYGLVIIEDGIPHFYHKEVPSAPSLW